MSRFGTIAESYTVSAALVYAPAQRSTHCRLHLPQSTSVTLACCTHTLPLHSLKLALTAFFSPLCAGTGGFAGTHNDKTMARFDNFLEQVKAGNMAIAHSKWPHQQGARHFKVYG